MMLPVDYTTNTIRYFKKLKDKKLKEIYKEAIINIRKNPGIGEAKAAE